jgi:polygalacturonase
MKIFDMGKKIGIIVFFYFTMITFLHGQQQISVLQFGAIPNDTLNDRLAIQKAVEHCKKNAIKKLIIPAGQYIIQEAKAMQLIEDVMSGKFGKNPQDVMYTPYYPYTRGVHFDGIRGLTVQAEGALFMVRGWMEPVSIVNCVDISINGLTIDYETRPHSEGLVIHETKEYFDVRFSDGFPVRENMMITRIMFWELAKNRLFGNSIYFPTKNEIIADQTLRIYASLPVKMLGNMALINHTFHFRPAILILESREVHLHQVSIHAQPGMGIVGHRSENILMGGLRIVPRPGEYQSTNTDATHFTSCKGLIRFDGCSFEGQGDDATNVHAYYQVIKNKVSEKTYTIEMEKAWGTHAMVLDYPDNNNIMELVSKKTLKVVGRYKVISSKPYPKDWKTIIQLNQTLPDDIENYYLIDVTRLPRLEFLNTYVGSHLARAVLVKTRHVLIENCTMRESTGTAIHIGAEGDWREGPGSENVIVRNNRIIRCGRGDGTNDGACAIAINVKAPDKSVAGIHQHILIEGNLIEGENAMFGVSVTGASDVNIRNNIFSGCKEAWNVTFSEKIRFENNYSGKKLLDNKSF